jgi:hypothetical protein
VTQRLEQELEQAGGVDVVIDDQDLHVAADPATTTHVRERSPRERARLLSQLFASPRVFIGMRDDSVSRMSLTSTLAHAQLRNHFHACAFVMSADEEQAIIDPFLVEGMKKRAKACYIVDPRHRDEHETRLRSKSESPDLVDVTTWQDAHLKGGSFNKERMMAALDDAIRDHAATGQPPMHLVGQMGWILTSPPKIDELIAYEASVNEVLNRGRTPTVCVYDVRKLSGSLMMDLLRAHPLTVMNGVLHENPFYTPAEQMLAEIQQRAAIN